MKNPADETMPEDVFVKIMPEGMPFEGMPYLADGGVKYTRPPTAPALDREAVRRALAALNGWLCDGERFTNLIGELTTAEKALCDEAETIRQLLQREGA